jgi:hypothetical protein
MGAIDTSPTATDVQLRLLREMTPARKLRLVEDANATARSLAIAGIRLRHPDATAAQQGRFLMDLALGKELAGRVYAASKKP